MHIVFWSPAWPLEKFHNGIVTYVHWMKRELERQGHRVSIFTHDLDPSATDSRVHKVGRSAWYRLLRRISGRRVTVEHEIFGASAGIASAIKRLHRREPVDVIEMEESFGWCAAIAEQTSLPVVVKLHGPAFLSMVGEELDTPFGREKVEREGIALRAAAAVISPCQSTLDQTIDRYALKPNLRRHIVNPMTLNSDVPLWTLDSCDRDAILFVGRFDLRKGGDVVLQAFSRVLTARRRSKLIFVGPDVGLVAPGGYRIQFEAYRDSLFPAGLRGQIDFRGRLSNREIAKLRTEAMVTLVASRWENQGYTLLEAMLQGCPVVSTDAGGCPESVIDGKTGLLAKSENAADFAAKLSSILEDPEGAAALGNAARRHVMELHSATKVAAESLEVYAEVISNQGQVSATLRDSPHTRGQRIDGP
jgi:glycosyltransferase involved in cell wall biosynthesis